MAPPTRLRPSASSGLRRGLCGSAEFWRYLWKHKNKWLPILEHMRTDWAQEIIELGREIKLVSIVLPVQPDEILYAATNAPLQNRTAALRIEDVD